MNPPRARAVSKYGIARRRSKAGLWFASRVIEMRDLPACGERCQFRPKAAQFGACPRPRFAAKGPQEFAWSPNFSGMAVECLLLCSLANREKLPRDRLHLAVLRHGVDGVGIGPRLSDRRGFR